MATYFSANQYDDAFVPKKLTNWQTPNLFQERPRSLRGCTKITTKDNGHLMPEYRRSKTEPWGNFVGTWDLPRRLPGPRIDVPTARSVEANAKLRREFEEPKVHLTNRRWGTYNNTFYKEGTRTFASTAPVRRRAKNMTSEYIGPIDSDQVSSSPAPRKLSPIDGRAKISDSSNVGGEGGRGMNEFDTSYAFNSNKIPLPQLDRPVYAETDERGRITISAL